MEKGQQIYVSGRLVSDTVEGDHGKLQKYYKVAYMISLLTSYSADFKNLSDMWTLNGIPFQVVVQQLNFVERNSPSPVALYDGTSDSMSGD